MLIPRIFSMVLYALLTAWCVWGHRRALNRLAASASLNRCPFCKYSLTGLISNTCPECGRSLSAKDIEENIRLQVTGQAVLLTGVLCLFLGLMHYFLCTDLLEIHRLVTMGPTAFIPGYSLLDPADGVPIAIIGAAVISLTINAAWAVMTARTVVRGASRKTVVVPQSS
jgi:hypothetical protein